MRLWVFGAGKKKVVLKSYTNCKPKIIWMEPRIPSVVISCFVFPKDENMKHNLNWMVL